MEIVKNPIIIGVLAGAITYGYLQWEVDKKNKKNVGHQQDFYCQPEI